MEENKFNFSEDELSQNSKQNSNFDKDNVVEQSKEALKEDAKGFFISLKTFLVELLDFRDDTDRDATIEAIKCDIPFKGATAWVLICSVFVASVGLNANSTAVVIGAMLISPLMGPILGIGMSLAINDIDTLKKSLINLTTMIVLSLLTAFLFFWLFPINQDVNELSELLGRTKPDIRDVLIAFFGGLALIIARTKKGTIASVIFGVAIATALMPPLCTAGYGLAQGNWAFFRGAMYLFTINTIFIALATFIVLKLLRFPMLKYANSTRRKRIAQFASLLAVIVMIPAVMTFVEVWKQSGLKNDYNSFITNEIKSNYELWFQNGIPKYDEKIIVLYFNGEITKATKTDLRNELKSYEAIKDFKLEINGNKNRGFDKISDAYDRAIKDLDQKNNTITELQTKIEALQEDISTLNQTIEQNINSLNNGVSFIELAKDTKIKFTDLKHLGYAKVLESKDFVTVDTVAVANVKWSTALNDSLKRIKEKELSNWLIQKLNIDTILIKRDL